MMEEYVWHYGYKGIVSMVRKGVRSTQKTLPSPHSPTPPLPRSALVSFPFRNKLCFSMALDPLTIIVIFHNLTWLAVYDCPGNDNRQRTNSWVGCSKCFFIGQQWYAFKTDTNWQIVRLPVKGLIYVIDIIFCCRAALMAMTLKITFVQMVIIMIWQHCSSPPKNQP